MQYENINFSLKNTKDSLVILVSLSTAVLALMISGVCVGLSIALINNYNSEMQFLTADMKKIQLKLNKTQITVFYSKFGFQTGLNNLQLSLNQSLNAFDILGNQISTLQTDKRTEYGE